MYGRTPTFWQRGLWDSCFKILVRALRFLCENGIERSVPRDHHLTSLCKLSIPPSLIMDSYNLHALIMKIDYSIIIKMEGLILQRWVKNENFVIKTNILMNI